MRLINSLLLGLVILTFAACEQEKIKSNSKGMKNVILVIGDGMGPQQISMLHSFLHFSKVNKEKLKHKSAFNELAKKGVTSLSATHPYGRLVVDSSCSATHLAAGVYSNSETLGVDKDGYEVETILEKAKKKGMKVGLVSDTRITHATPASFAAHVANRWEEDEIARQLIKNDVDVLLSGGANRFIPMGESLTTTDGRVFASKRKDDLNLFEMAKKQNYKIVHNLSDNKTLKKNDKVLGLYTEHSYPDSLTQWNNYHNKKRVIPNLLEMTKVAIEQLDNDNSPFFLMVEAGQIDWSSHANDAGQLLFEMLSINETLNWLLSWQAEHPDTLLVVTADHETGGFGFGYHAAGEKRKLDLKGPLFSDKENIQAMNYVAPNVMDILYNQKTVLAQIWKDFAKLERSQKTAATLQKLIYDTINIQLDLKMCDSILKNANLDGKAIMPGREAFYSNSYNTLTALISNALAPDLGVVWATGGHTATPVSVYALGPEKFINNFKGHLHHTKIGKLLQDYLLH